MDDIQSLIEELRFGAENGADAELLERAADKIRELVADLGDADAIERSNMERCECLRKQLRESHESYEKHLNELEAQLPKRGKWIWDDKRCIYVCSVCGSPKVRENMDRQIIKEQAYCYSCGAKMEVQE